MENKTETVWAVKQSVFKAKCDVLKDKGYKIISCGCLINNDNDNEWWAILEKVEE